MSSNSFFDNAENYQPLREGRAGNVVMQGGVEPSKARKAAADARRALEHEREAGTEDPLAAHIAYVEKLKGLHPSGSKEIDDALYNVANIFHDRPEYKNDPRLFGVFLQIADRQKDPRVTFDFMVEHGVGDELPRFHLARAAVYERAKDYKTAEESYQRAVAVAKGGKKEVFDLATLHLAHFKRRMARKAQETRALKGPNSPEAANAARTASRALRPAVPVQQQQGVNPVRLGGAVSAKRPQFQVFEDHPQHQAQGLRPAEAVWPQLPTDATLVENHGPAQPWTAVQPVSQRASAMKPPAFPIFRDDAPPESASCDRQSLRQPSSTQSAIKPPSFPVYRHDLPPESAAKPPSFPVFRDDVPPESAIKPPSFPIYRDDMAPGSSDKPALRAPVGGSAIKPPSFVVYAEPGTVPLPTPKPPSFSVYQESRVQPTPRPPSFAVYSESTQKDNVSVNQETIASTPMSDDTRAEQTINTRRAMDDMYEMFASPSMSVARRTQRTAGTNRQPRTGFRHNMYTPAVWPRLDEEDDDDGDQNVSSNVFDSASRREAALATTERHRRPRQSVGSANRPVLRTLEHHEDRMSPSSRQELRNPPHMPQEQFVVARDLPVNANVAPLGDDDDDDEDGDVDENTFGISSVLAFDQRQRGGRN